MLEWLRFRRLQAALDRLINNEEFVFGKSSELDARNPSIWQIVKLGFFNPDKEPTGKESLSSEDWHDYVDKLDTTKTATSAKKPKFESKEGFNLNFMRLMALHGFDHGAEWGGAQDSMHFELIEMKEKIAPVKGSD